jgi:hypothetical protein
MTTTHIAQPSSRVRFGLAQADITPPAGIYHRWWGAARHDRATGVHRPLQADVMAFAPVNAAKPALVRAQIDCCVLAESTHADLAQALSETAGVPRDGVVVTYSHSHSAARVTPDRAHLPGGELIEPYLRALRGKLADAARRAVAALQEAVITYATGRCRLAANRDCWDEAARQFVCGYNPDVPADDTVVVARATDAAGGVVATVVNYACHPTTLAWQNSLISPDYVGALRETVTQATGAPCVFLQGACGDLGPRHGFVGDPAVADSNGRQVAYAALSAIETMGPPAHDHRYTGPVVSGATLGTWAYEPMSAARLARISRFDGGAFTVDLPIKPLPTRAALESDLERWTAGQRAADARGDAVAARDAGARAERARRWRSRLDELPATGRFSLHCSAHRMGDALWVTCGGEPYNAIQRELRRRFPQMTVLFSPLAGDSVAGYLLERDRYGKGLYQEEPSILAPGCLETLTDAIAERIKANLKETP